MLFYYALKEIFQDLTVITNKSFLLIRVQKIFSVFLGDCITAFIIILYSAFLIFIKESLQIDK